MFKKVVSLVLALTLCLGACLALTACEKDEFKAALICLHGSNSTYDKNFMDGFTQACKNLGLSEDQYTIIDGIDEDTVCYDKAAIFADEGYDFIFADSFGHEPHMIQAAKEFPNVEFCHATGTSAHTANVANFHNAFASIYEGRYLAGVAAGMKLLELYDKDSDGVITNDEAKIGYVGAHPYAEVISGFTSFYLGVKSLVPNVTMTVRYTNSWYDETAEKSTALALIDEGCKLISQHADSMGAPTACEERGIPNVAYNGATDKNTFVIASRIDWTPYFETAIRAAMNGEAIPTDYVGTLATGSVVISAAGPAAASGTDAKIAEVKTQLMNGSIKVFDCSKFTVNNAMADKSLFSKAGSITADAEGHLTAYTADVDDMGDYVPETNVIKTVGGVTYFAESEFRSAPYFDIIIDGITSISE